MSEESDSKDMRDEAYGISTDGNVHIGNINGQFAIGKNISQVQYMPAIDIEQLRKSLLAFREEFVKLDLSSEEQEIVKGDVSAALKEAGKEEPRLPNIKTRVENVIETFKDAGKTVKNISETCGSLKIVAGLLGIVL